MWTVNQPEIDSIFWEVLNIRSKPLDNLDENSHFIFFNILNNPLSQLHHHLRSEQVLQSELEDFVKFHKMIVVFWACEAILEHMWSEMNKPE